jgi:hypothetical protein
VKDDPIDRFLELIQSDPALQRELGTAANEGEKPGLSVQRLVELGERYGYGFTADELRARLGAAPRSLSDAELAHVAGGVGGSSVGRSGFKIEIEGISQHRGGGCNELSLDDTAGKEK